MPQMAPMSWLVLFLFFTLMFFIFNIINFFSINNKKNFNFYKKMNKQLNNNLLFLKWMW
ncbi:ATP8 [Clunio marinus]|uniref:ATP synthase protein 8 n=1 Tax=Clunio marinus TaxID=568069 RepID=A0A1J1JAZ4_9DIPT|nr:ATP8 [Clunio marinus]